MYTELTIRGVYWSVQESVGLCVALSLSCTVEFTRKGVCCSV